MIHIEVRKKIIEAREKGLTVRELSKAYGCSESAINRLLRQYRQSGSIAPRTYLRGRKPAIGTEGMEALRDLILSQPDITLAEIKEAMGLSISLAAICKIVKRKLGFKYKKRQYTPVSGTDLMSRKGGDYGRKQIG